MRDPKRIQPLLAKIAEFWYQNPDLRLGQVLARLGDIGITFYVEDDAALKLLEAELLALAKGSTSG